jgi:hypothetical protein
VVQGIEPLRTVHSDHKDLSVTLSLDDSHSFRLLCHNGNDRRFLPLL